MDILKNNQDYINEPSWKNILKYLNEDELSKMQESIVNLGLSSHMMIICKKN